MRRGNLNAFVYIYTENSIQELLPYFAYNDFELEKLEIF